MTPDTRFGPLGADQNAVFEARALSREIANIADQLNIDATAGTVTWTNEFDEVRTFAADGKKHKLNLISAKVDARATWRDDQLVIELSTARLNVVQTLLVSVGGRHLVVTITATSPGARSGEAGATHLTRVYERVAQKTP